VPCKKTHSLGLKDEFEKHAKTEIYRKEYEDSLIRRLEDIVSEVDKRVSVEKPPMGPPRLTTPSTRTPPSARASPGHWTASSTVFPSGACPT